MKNYIVLDKSKNNPAWLEKIIDENSDSYKVIILFYTLQYTYQCRHMNERIKDMSQEFKDYLFIEIDMIIFEDLKRVSVIHALPHIQVFQNNHISVRYTGSNPSQFKNKLVNNIKTIKEK